MRLHVEALFTHDPQGCLIGVNVPNGAPAPRFFIGSTDNGSVVRWRSDVDGDTQRDLEAAAANDQRPLDVAAAPADISVYAEILGRSAPVERTWSGPAFCFPKRLPATIGAVAITSENASVLQPLLPAWIPDVDLNPPVFAVIVDGQACAAASGEPARRTKPESRQFRPFAAKAMQAGPWSRGRGRSETWDAFPCIAHYGRTRRRVRLHARSD
jgi:hypothetical protein